MKRREARSLIFARVAVASRVYAVLTLRQGVLHLFLQGKKVPVVKFRRRKEPQESKRGYKS